MQVFKENAQRMTELGNSMEPRFNTDLMSKVWRQVIGSLNHFPPISLVINFLFAENDQ